MVREKQINCNKPQHKYFWHYLTGFKHILLKAGLSDASISLQIFHVTLSFITYRVIQVFISVLVYVKYIDQDIKWNKPVNHFNIGTTTSSKTKHFKLLVKNNKHSATVMVEIKCWHPKIWLCNTQNLIEA